VCVCVCVCVYSPVINATGDGKDGSEAVGHRNAV